ncbi:MAG: hypothetical protein ACRCWR_00235 [Saezia sp.]
MMFATKQMYDFYNSVLLWSREDKDKLNSEIALLKNHHYAMTFIRARTEMSNTLICVNDLRDENGYFVVFLSKSDGISHDISFDFEAYELFDCKALKVGRLSAEFNESAGNMFIVEVGTERNKGYGSCLIELLKSIGKEYSVSIITGNLESTDLLDKYDPEHKSRMLHFYEKHGFKIKLNADESAGSILFQYPK